MGFPDESEYQGGTTSGELVHGIFAFSNHEVYDGEWRDNKLEGRGTVSDDHRLRREENPRDEFRGTHYAGEWKQNRFDGEGSYTWASGSTYTGQWKEGKKHGKGKYVLTNTNSYEGEWVEDEMHGEGVYATRVIGKDAITSLYEGQWEHDHRAGAATTTYADGDVEVQRWEPGPLHDAPGGPAPTRSDRRVGPGVRWCADGTKAWRLLDGIAGDEIELEEAATIAATIGRPVPDFPRPVLSTSKFG